MKKAIVLFLIIFTSILTNGFSQTTTEFFRDADTFFKTYVKNGKVNYKEIKQNEASLSSLLEKASRITVASSRAAEYQSFWINAYNLSVIQGVIANYPIESPLDIDGFFDATTYSLGGVDITLNDIENKKLRAQFDEPRFHFVLVCGAKGCPPLIAEAYKPATLEKQLQRQTVKALNDSSFIKVFEAKIAISEIFSWYKEDFVKNGMNEIDFLNLYRKEKISSDCIIEYYSYDWRLNSY